MRQLQKRSLEFLSKVIFKYSWIIIAAFTGLAVFGFFYTTSNLGVNSNTAEMFDEQLPFRQLRDQYKQIFPATEDNMVIVVSGEVPEMVASTADSLAEEFKSREDLYQSVFQPTGEDFFKKHQLMYLDTTTLIQLSEQLIKARPMMAFLSENYSLKGLFSFLGLMIRYSSADQREGIAPMINKMDSVLLTTLSGGEQLLSWQHLMGTESLGETGYSFIQIKPVLDYSKIRPAKEAIEQAHSIAADYTSKYVRVRITGKKAMTYEEMGSVMAGAIQASILALFMVSLILWFGLKSLRLIAATLYTLIIGLILTATFSTWAVGHLNMISVAFAVLYIGLGVDYAIHICLRYREFLGDAMDIKSAIASSIHHIAPALILSTLSTSIGFYAFIPTDFTGVSELGIIAGTGMFISLVVTVVLLPCLLHIMSGWRSQRVSDRRIIKGPIVEKYYRQIRWVTLGLTVAALLILPNIAFDYDPINLRDPNSESVATVRELMAEQNFTPWSLNVVSEDSTALANSKAKLRALPEVGQVINLFSFVPVQQSVKIARIHQIKAELGQISKPSFVFDAVPIPDQERSISEFGKLLSSAAYAGNKSLEQFGEHLMVLSDTLRQLDAPEAKALVEKFQYGLMAALPYTVTGLINSLEPGPVSLANLPPALTERWVSNRGQFRTQVMPAEVLHTNDDMKKFASAVQQVAPEATGDLMVTIASGDTVIAAFRQAIWYALVAISILLMIYLRSIRETLFILLPLILAGIFSAALTVLLGIEFNFANIIAIPLLLGLGVDNGVHIVHRAKTESGGKSLLQTSTARAVFFSSFTTLFSFGNLAFSPHRGTASMGWLLTIGVIFVVLTTLLVLPAFLPKTGPKIRD